MARYSALVGTPMAEHWPRTLDTHLAINSCKEIVAANFFAVIVLKHCCSKYIFEFADTEALKVVVSPSVMKTSELKSVWLE